MDATPDKAGRLPVLILGGTTEASDLVRALAQSERFALTLSLAGRTSRRAKSSMPMRVGGFGGVEGLSAWIVENGIALVVDATHPFAARISWNAALASAQTRVPLLAIRRPAWVREEGDTWIEVDDMEQAAAAIGSAPRRVFLTIGRQELAAFAAAPQHDYIARTIEPVGDAVSLPRLTEISARGPFTLDDEIAVLREAKTEVLVTKNSGGAATYAKIAAARELGLPVIIVRRPDLPDVPSVLNAAGAAAWLEKASDLTPPWQAQPGTLRGV